MIWTIVACASLTFAGMGQSDSTVRSRPNILFLLSDDQRADTIHALGNSVISTPNLDTLVRRGTTFTRAFCPNPICVPSRAEILTGCSGFRNGILPGYSDKFRAGVPFWPETFRAAGYRTGYVGKWHTAGRPSQRGYSESLGLFSSGKGPAPKQFDYRGAEATGYLGWVFQSDSGVRFPEQGVGLAPDISVKFANAAIELIREPDPRPFFLHVNFTAPHDPLLFPPGDERKYDPASIPTPADFLPRHPFDHGNIEGRDERLLPWPRTEAMVRADRAAYYAVITHLDEQIGRILDALADSGKAENTVVIFSSDHGLSIGSHGLRGKQNMYDHTIRVPLIIAGPKIAANVRNDAFVYLRDLFPTACDLAGIAIPAAVEGRSFASVLGGARERGHEQVFGYFMDAQRMIRTEHWKLIAYPRIARIQLFDLASDPYELRDLSADPKHADMVAELRGKLSNWQTTVGDPSASVLGTICLGIAGHPVLRRCR